MSLSIDDFFRCPFTLDRLRNCGYLSCHLNLFAEWLYKQMFSKFTLRFHISNVAHFSQSLEGIEPDIQEIDAHIKFFLYKHIPTCECKGWKKPRKPKSISYSLNRFKEYLVDYHGFDFISKNLAFSKIHNEYLCWLFEKFKLANSTIELRSGYLKQFLHWFKEECPFHDLHNLTPYDVELFFIKATSRWGTAYKRSLQATLRSFFDFCHEQKYTTQNLRFSLPVIKTYRLSEIPKKIDENEAIKLIDSIDRSTASGKRTYAILLLLYTYGVRGCQVSSLKLKNIDWHKEEIHFPSVKHGKKCSFPLFADVGNAILDYLKNARQKCQYQEVFLNLKGPCKPLTTNNNLYQIIRTAMLKADIKSPSKGSHCFRHGFVSRMLKQGEAFKHIADLLGHKHIQTTFIYTKIDFNSLAEVALELPEVDYENC